MSFFPFFFPKEKKLGEKIMNGRHFVEVFYLVLSFFSVLLLLLSSPVLMLILMTERVAWVRRILLG